MTVPQVGHLPLMAFRPFFMVSSTPLEISFLALHLTQYPSAINIFVALASCLNDSISLSAKGESVNSKAKTLKNKGFRENKKGEAQRLA